MMTRNIMVTVLLLSLLFFAACEKHVATSDEAGEPGAGDLSSGNEDANKTDYTYVKEHITDISCDVNKHCPAGLECWSLSGAELGGPRCVDPDPVEWYCGGGTQHIVTMSEPPGLTCQSK